jgi:hypothetical protein
MNLITTLNRYNILIPSSFSSFKLFYYSFFVEDFFIKENYKIINKENKINNLRNYISINNNYK